MKHFVLGWSASLGGILVSLVPWIEPGLRVMSLSLGIVLTLILIRNALRAPKAERKGYAEDIADQMDRTRDEIEGE